MKRFIVLFTLLFINICLFAQGLPRRIPGGNTPREGRPNDSPTEDRDRDRNDEENIDSIRAKLEAKRDSIIYNSKYIKFTKEHFLRDSVRLIAIDTTLKNFHQYRILDEPANPTMNLGLNGLAYRDMLFSPSKTIGFDVGYHYYDRYLILPDSVNYYQARSPFTEFYLQNPAFGRLTEQSFRMVHTQNIKPNWNIGGSYAKLGSRAYYGSPQKRSDNLMANHLNAAIWNWYQSKNKRYTILANGVFNNLKTYDNGSILNDSVFTRETRIRPEFEVARLNFAQHNWRNNSLYVKQFYNIGNQRNVDLIDSTSAVLPTQRISYKFLYNTSKFLFNNPEVDQSNLLKNYYINPSATADTTTLKHYQNEFSYSFYVRGNQLSFLKNELKVNAGIRHDLYRYQQYTFDTNFQNITIVGDATYNFSDRASLLLEVQQIIQGRNAGDFLYQAISEIKLGNKIGRIRLEAYSQNQSPAMIYERQFSNHHRWNINFNKTQTQNIAFTYSIPKFAFSGRADYFLTTNHHYFVSGADGDAFPAEFGDPINLLKLTLRKDFRFGKFTLENFGVYQKTDFENVLRVPNLYTFHSFYFHQEFFKKVLKADFGFDVRYNSKYTSLSYAPSIGTFYNSTNNPQFDTYPIADVWVRVNWKRANLFLRYDYANQGVFSKGYYTVDRYPMPYALAKFGVVWRFYD